MSLLGQHLCFSGYRVPAPILFPKSSSVFSTFIFYLQELVMDILRVLSSPDLEVRRKTLGLAMELVTSR